LAVYLNAPLRAPHRLHLHSDQNQCGCGQELLRTRLQVGDLACHYPSPLCGGHGVFSREMLIIPHPPAAQKIRLDWSSTSPKSAKAMDYLSTDIAYGEKIVSLMRAISVSALQVLLRVLLSSYPLRLKPVAWILMQVMSTMQGPWHRLLPLNHASSNEDVYTISKFMRGKPTISHASNHGTCFPFCSASVLTYLHSAELA
jgi:hypothetical protein